jgi:hypothetical protein
MTICRTTEFGGIPGATARPAEMTRIDSLPGGARTATVPPRQGPRVPAVRRAQPPDYELLLRVRDGLMRL